MRIKFEVVGDDFLEECPYRKGWKIGSNDCLCCRWNSNIDFKNNIVCCDYSDEKDKEHEEDVKKEIKTICELDNERKELGLSTKPSYYNKGIEVLDFIQSWGLDFSLGNVIKYVCRANYKHDNPMEDLLKAKDYLERKIKYLEEQNG